MSLASEGASLRLGSRLVVDGVDVRVAPGSVTALIGPNGAGKSSLIRLLAGVAAPVAGRVLLDDRDLAAITRRERARLVALVEQDATTDLSITVREVVALGRTPHSGLFSDPDPSAVDRALETAGAAYWAPREFSSLSGGERQRVHLARALAQQPRILLLDEPTNHLDVSAQLAVLGLVRQLATEGTAVLTALHDLNLAAAYADTVVVLAAGRVVAAGAPAAVLTKQLVESVYGVTATVLQHPVTGGPLIAFSPPTPD